MTKKQELEIVKELIKDGYNNLDTISFELDIPMNTLEELKQQVEREKLKATRDNICVSSRITTMKERYNWLFHRVNHSTNSTIDNKHYENIKVEMSINKIANMSSKGNAVNRAMDILKIIKNLDNENFSEGQLEKIVKLLYDKDTFEVPSSTSNRGLIRMMSLYKQKYVSKLAQEIGNRKNSISNISELQKLKLIITPEMEKEFPICVTPVKMQIDSKISKLTKERALSNLENNYSKTIQEIATKIVGENIDIESIQEDVKNEINSQMNNSTKGRFSLSESGHKDQILYKIGILLKSKADKYDIINEDETMKALKTVFGKDDGSNLKVIVNNYIAKKEYKRAYSICDKYDRNDAEYGDVAKKINILRNKIKCAEIGDIVLRGLNSNASYDELEKFKNVVENEINKYGIKPSSIPLGKNKDKTKDITLEDIMTDSKELY